MAKIRLKPIGFWSYVRRDDERSRGKISELRELVLAELETQIGGDVPVFKDTISIPHGVRWEELTQRALSDATFFIPILTPAFLQSEWCCREVRLFLRREQELLATYPDLPRRSRIFPIHYVDVEEDAETTDEFVRETLMELQHFSFQRKRNLAFHSPEVSDFISNFVTDIRDLLRCRVEIREEAPPPPAAATTPPPATEPPGPVPAGDATRAVIEEYESAEPRQPPSGAGGQALCLDVERPPEAPIENPDFFETAGLLVGKLRRSWRRLAILIVLIGIVAAGAIIIAIVKGERQRIADAAAADAEARANPSYYVANYCDVPLDLYLSWETAAGWQARALTLARFQSAGLHDYGIDPTSSRFYYYARTADGREYIRGDSFHEFGNLGRFPALFTEVPEGSPGQYTLELPCQESEAENASAPAALTNAAY